jgi:hypothetical protein
MGGIGKLVYSAIASLDGFVADQEGRFDWAVLAVRAAHRAREHSPSG